MPGGAIGSSAIWESSWKGIKNIAGVSTCAVVDVLISQDSRHGGAGWVSKHEHIVSWNAREMEGSEGSERSLYR